MIHYPLSHILSTKFYLPKSDGSLCGNSQIIDVRQKTELVTCKKNTIKKMS